MRSLFLFAHLNINMKLITRNLTIPGANRTIIALQIINQPTLEFLLVEDNRTVSIFNPEAETVEPVSTLPPDINLGNLEIYSFKTYVALVDNKGTAGIVWNLEDSQYQKDLVRGDYQVEHCSFPIAFYEKDNQTFLIHGTDWNRLDITCLETDELLTDRRIDQDSELNYLDYFHSQLAVSPDNKYFISNGWYWQPYDVITIYTIADFLHLYELEHREVSLDGRDAGYLWDRPLAWVDPETFAIGWNQQEVDDDEEFPSELLFITARDNQIVKRIEVDGFDVHSGKLFHDPEQQRLIACNNEQGLTVVDYDGRVLLREPKFEADGYSEYFGWFFYRSKNKLVLTRLGQD